MEVEGQGAFGFVHLPPYSRNSEDFCFISYTFGNCKKYIFLIILLWLIKLVVHVKNANLMGEKCCMLNLF